MIGGTYWSDERNRMFILSSCGALLERTGFRVLKYLDVQTIFEDAFKELTLSYDRNINLPLGMHVHSLADRKFKVLLGGTGTVHTWLCTILSFVVNIMMLK